VADPVTLAGTSLGATLAGGGVSTLGALQSGGAQSSAYRYQAGVAAMNASIAENNANYATAVGESKAQISGMQTRAQIGATKAIQSGTNLNVNTGSAVDVRASEADIGEENEMTIRSNAAREAYGFRTQAAGDIAQENLYNAAASNTKKASNINALTSILGTAASVSSKWAMFSKQGIGGGGGSNDSDAGIYS
jgi:hypothetical protein